MMKLFIVFVVFVLFGVSSGQNTTTTSTTPKTTTTSTTQKTTTSTTVAPKTTTPSTTTTTTIKPTPMPTPAKEVDPPVVSYNLTDPEHKNVVCIMAQMAAQLVFTYKNTLNKSETAYINLSNHTTVGGKSTCNNESATLILQVDGNEKNVLTLDIKRDAGVDLVDQIMVSFTLNEQQFPLHPNVSQVNVTASNVTMFKSQLGKSYVCDSKAEWKLGVAQDVAVVLELSKVKFNAFRTKPNTGFQEGQVCRADDEVSDIVPIAVGIALVSLVVVVLVAYVIGRRRSRRMAYQSV